MRTISAPLASLAVALTLTASACAAPERTVSLVAEPAATVVTVQATFCGPVREPPTPSPWLPAAPTPRRSQTMLRDAMPALASLPSADRVIVQRSWNGRSPIAPRSATSTLTRSRDGFTGEAQLRVTINRGAGETREQRLPVTVPNAVMESVLRDLMAVAVVPGPYTPRIEWTDDYPDDLIQVSFGGRQVRFFSQSQGADQVPWGIETDGQIVVSDSVNTARALRRLDGCLRTDAYDAMISRADADFRFGPQAAPGSQP